jgi:1-deoxy-D-xylulose-5-phosphate reductoisomerase
MSLISATNLHTTSSRGVIPAPGATFDPPSPLRLVLLGATGSIGRQTLDVCRRHTDKVKLVALAANTSVSRLVELAREFPTVERIALSSETCAESGDLASLPKGCSAVFGKREVDSLPQAVGCDIVLNALSGFAGMRASLAALESGKILALANKESLVAGGDLLMPLAEPGKLLPVDSEHSAIFQCFSGEDPWRATRIWLTASGGPFFGMRAEDLEDVTAEEALRHPNWNMGKRITIDSSTLMNKGLEVIEAHHLFDMPYDDIRPVVQRQSAVHSMVEFSDGSVKAHLGAPDMRVPIQLALSFPSRWDAPAQPVDWAELGRIDFADPDLETFPCLRIAIAAGRVGGVLPCAMNASDEIAVASFLSGRIGYRDIARVVANVLDTFEPEAVESVEQLEQVDADARIRAKEAIAAIPHP